MDSYSFEFEGKTVTVVDRVVHYPAPLRPIPALCAEILKLAEDRAKFKRWAEEECGKAAAAQYREDQAREALNEETRSQRAIAASLRNDLAALSNEKTLVDEERDALREDNDALRMTVEEGREVEHEITTALAVLAGESLIPCGDRKTCPGHFGPKTLAVFEAALAAHHALLQGNRVAAERIAKLELDVLSLQSKLALAEARAERAENRADDMLDAEAAISANAPYEDGAEVLAILRPFRPLVDLGQAPESPANTLRRIIRERDEWMAKSSTVVRENTALEAQRERYRRDLILAIGEIRELLERLERADAEAEILAGKLLRYDALMALLDQPDTPPAFHKRVVDRKLRATSSADWTLAVELWRWLREQVQGGGVAVDDRGAG